MSFLNSPPVLSSIIQASLLNGNFGEIFYFQTDPIPLACPLIKQLSDDLDAKIQNINNFKPTEEMQLEKLSNRLRENLQHRWQI